MAGRLDKKAKGSSKLRISLDELTSDDEPSFVGGDKTYEGISDYMKE